MPTYKQLPLQHKKRSTEKAIDEVHKALEGGAHQFVIYGCLLLDGFSQEKARMILAWAKNRMPKLMENGNDNS